MKIKTLVLSSLAVLSIGAAAVVVKPQAASANWGCTNHLYKQGVAVDVLV